MSLPGEKPKDGEKPKETEKAEVRRIVTPILSKAFLLQPAAYQMHNALIPAGITKDDLTNPRMWNHVSSKIKLHDEIRAVAEDGSFLAKLLVTFKHSLDVGVKVLEFYQLEEVDYEKEAGLDEYDIKNRGALGWCVIDKKNGKNIKTNCASQAEAFTERDEYVTRLKQAAK
tara:strand:- start:48 stop:560 length:513 start_codon:yes stop_codon:yes gene_type:complete